MNDNTRMPDGRPEPTANDTARQQVLGPTDALTEPTLAVDLARVDLDQAIATAHKFPRKLDTIVRQIEQMALYDEAAAERCIYMLPRANKAIVGPSIGFANILATAWGNCRDGGRWVRTDRAEKVVVCEGAFFDLETNRQTIAPAVRRIVDSRGQLYSADMITVTAQAGAAIARRNAILNGVPRPLWHPTYEKALVVVRGTEATLGERRTKMVAAFAAFGVAPKDVFMALGIKAESEITLDHIVMLRGMYESLKDGTATPEEMFNPRRMVAAAFERMPNPMADDETDERDETAGQGQPAARPAAAAPAPAPQATAAAPAPAPGAAPPPAKPAKRPRPGRPTNAELEERKRLAEQQATGAQPAPAPAAVEQAPAAKEPAPAAPTPPQEPAPPPPQEQRPRTTAEYEIHLERWLAACASPSEVDDHWRHKDERTLRGECSIIEDDFERMRAKMERRKAELKGG